jgi:signal transduction histidine kinase
MELLRWLSDSDQDPGPGRAVPWALVTVALAAVAVGGYAVLALNWYFQSRLTDRAAARAAVTRLRRIALCSAGCGLAFYASDASWRSWRLYDLALALLGAWTWWSVLRTRGLGVVREQLALLGELERSARNFREIAEFLPHIVWTATAAGRVDFANRTWVAYAGEGRTWLDAVHPDERPHVVAWWAGVVAAGAAASREVRLAAAANGGRAGAGEPGGGEPTSGGRAGGAYRTFLVSVSPIARGRTVKWLGACVDVEDQKRLAAERESQARQKMFFLNALGHDLRAPLNNVTLNAHLLKMSARDPADVQVVDLIVENAVAAGDMVTNLLEFARMGAEERNVVERVSLAATLQQVVRRFQPVAETKRLELCAAGCPGGDVELDTDRLKLERVLGNLIDNAIKYTDRGGVTVECVVREGDDAGNAGANRQGGGGGGDAGGDRQGRGGGGVVVVRVTDTGIGVPAADVPHLFDEFYQVGNHERDRSKGFGMGLAICRCLARQLGGDVRLARTGPDGSCFELLLGGLRGSGTGGDGDRVRARRRGRPGGPAGHLPDPHPAGFCTA